MRNPNDSNDVSFIRLLFKAPVQDEIAFRWASRLGKLVGSRVMALRPDTTLAEMLEWAATSGADSMSFLVVFEPELRMEFAQFLDDADHTTFRDLVESYASRFEDCT